MDQDTAVLNHTGLCVADAERSASFYCAVFGFHRWRTDDLADELTADLLELTPPVGMHAVYLRLGGFVLELLEYRGRTPRRPVTLRTMDEVGLTHLSLSVADIETTCARVLEHGGSVVPGARLGALAQMVRDPDGQLVELLTLGYARRVAAVP